MKSNNELIELYSPKRVQIVYARVAMVSLALCGPLFLLMPNWRFLLPVVVGIAAQAAYSALRASRPRAVLGPDTIKWQNGFFGTEEIPLSDIASVDKKFGDYYLNLRSGKSKKMSVRQLSSEQQALVADWLNLYFSEVYSAGA